jgi:hypothetical protein
MLLRHLQCTLHHPVISTQALVQQESSPGSRIRRRQSGSEWHHRRDGDRADAKEESEIQEIHPYLYVWYSLPHLGSCSAMILFFPLLETNVLALASLVSAYNSFFLIPLVPIMLELAC